MGARLDELREIAQLLRGRAEEVARVYAPGGYLDGQQWRALNPGRADRRIGSFWVNVGGALQGRWHDAATGQSGDMLDLIQLALGCDRRAALEEARGFLGLTEASPARAELARRAARARAASEARARAEEADRIDRMRRAAQRLWLEGQVELTGTPAAAYLAGRGINLGELPRLPGAIRFHPAAPWRHVDPETGEVLERALPAMLAAIHGPHVPDGRPAFWGVHRTYLAQEGGRWRKAPVHAPKKVLGSVKGGFIRLWSGLGPRGGKGAPLSRAAGARVYVTEGIEDGLSVALLRPEARVICCVALSFLGDMGLPEAVRELVICADNDEGAQARAQLARAIGQHQAAGRQVFELRNQWGGKDMNDALRAAKGLA